MSASQALVVGVLVALFGWLLKSSIGWYLRRMAISDALLSDIRRQMESWQRNEKFLDRLLDSDLSVGKKVPYSARFDPPKRNLFDALLSELVSHVPYHFGNLSKIYATFREAEELLSGILQDLTVWKQRGRELSKSDIDYLKAKRSRIKSYVEIFTRQPLSKLSDLPSDYRGIQGTETVTARIQPPE